ARSLLPRIPQSYWSDVQGHPNARPLPQSVDTKPAMCREVAKSAAHACPEDTWPALDFENVGWRQPLRLLRGERFCRTLDTIAHAMSVERIHGVVIRGLRRQLIHSHAK